MKLEIQLFGGRGQSSNGKRSTSKNPIYSKILDKSLSLATASTPTISDYENSIKAMGNNETFQYKKEEYQKEISYLKKRQTLADGKITGYTVDEIAEKVKSGRSYLINDRDIYFLNYDKKTHKFKSTKVYHKSSGISIAGRGRHFFMKDTDVRDLVKD